MLELDFGCGGFSKVLHLIDNLPGTGAAGGGFAFVAAKALLCDGLLY